MDSDIFKHIERRANLDPGYWNDPFLAWDDEILV